ncbi:hypothetical protein HD884_002173 [Ochrobactrum intermedium]|uniref:hypothetical protein n=1 Tax=Brucella intermedia TaxID=94625 RepID=UPI0007C298C7|nr:hypothetical protein [Brucella intermedia]NYD82110.1 hypothetical protein [Brucella intermedia]OAB82888.1 hypothetical protein A4G21_10355 [Brucella intermedia]
MTQPLITRLSKLDAPDRGMDAEIEVAVRRIEAARSGLAEEYWANWQASPDGTVYDPHTRYSSQPFTASVDAAIALAARVLPGWTFEHIGQDYIRASGLDNDVMPMGWTVEISDGSQTIQGQAPTLPLAICIALLRAKEANHV